jgi:hypothetical protein
MLFIIISVIIINGDKKHGHGKFVLNKIRMIGDGSPEFACLPIYA